MSKIPRPYKFAPDDTELSLTLSASNSVPRDKDTINRSATVFCDLDFILETGDSSHDLPLQPKREGYAQAFVDRFRDPPSRSCGHTSSKQSVQAHIQVRGANGTTCKDRSHLLLAPLQVRPYEEPETKPYVPMVLWAPWHFQVQTQTRRQIPVLPSVCAVRPWAEEWTLIPWPQPPREA